MKAVKKMLVSMKLHLDGKAVLIYGRHGHLDYIDIDALNSQVRECLDRYMTNK